MSGSVSTLLSRVSADREQVKIQSSNIARSEVEGHTRKDSQYQVRNHDGIGGVKIGRITRHVNQTLQESIFRQNSLYHKEDVQKTYMEQISYMFGNKGEELSYVHDLGRFSSTLIEIIGNPDPAKKSDAVFNANVFASKVRQISDKVSEIRDLVDKDIHTSIQTVNQLCTEIAQYNDEIYTLSINNIDITSLEDERDLCIHKLSEELDVQVFLNGNNKLSVYTQTGDILVQNNLSYALGYSPTTSVSPGDILSPITNSAGVDITSEFRSDQSTGKIAGLITLRDTTLVEMQWRLDEFSRVVRDEANIIHNEGSAIGGPDTLTGTSRVPGMVMGTTLEDTTQTTGNGMLRIGVIDYDGTLLDYKDINLTTAGNTVDDLLDAINSTPYGTSDPEGTFTIDFANGIDGALQITSTAGHTIAITGVTGYDKPQMSLGNSFDPDTALGFSHFFGLNNLFTTHDFLYDNTSAQAEPGISNTLSIRADIRLNANALAIGRLTQEDPPSTARGSALGIRQSDILRDMQTKISQGPMHFRATGSMVSVVTSAVDYAERILSHTQMELDNVRSNAALKKSEYDKLSTTAHLESAVDPSAVMMEIYQLSIAQQITAKALQTVLSMEKELFSTLSGV